MSNILENPSYMLIQRNPEQVGLPLLFILLCLSAAMLGCSSFFTFLRAVLLVHASACATFSLDVELDVQLLDKTVIDDLCAINFEIYQCKASSNSALVTCPLLW